MSIVENDPSNYDKTEIEKCEKIFFLKLVDSTTAAAVADPSKNLNLEATEFASTSTGGKLFFPGSKTSHHLERRISKHRGISSRAGLPLAKPKTNMYSHFLDTAHEINRSFFKIIFYAQNSSLKLMESIFIH